jgi:molecular chaperone GrpE
MTLEEQHTAPTVSPERAEIERLKGELSREHDLYLRAMADFDNYRRRVERDRENAVKRDKRALLLALVDLVDDFDRALAHVDNSSDTVRSGVRAIQRQLLRVLEAQGVKAFESVGQAFDPAVHEAVGAEQSDQHEAGTILEELRRGYHWNGEVLRPARVRVAQ